MELCSAKGATEASLRDAEGEGEGEEGVRRPNKSEGKRAQTQRGKGGCIRCGILCTGYIYILWGMR